MDIALYKRSLKERGWIYEDLAKASGVSLSTIRRIMAGIIGDPRTSTIEAIEKALGINVMPTAEERASGWTDTKKMNVTPDEEDVLTAFRKVKQKYGDALNKSILIYLNALIEK